MRKEKNRIIIIIINISGRSSLEEVNHVKSKVKSMGPMGRIIGGYPWAVGTHSAV
jgi:hypothetical protein